jgi:hypothetical protein
MPIALVMLLVGLFVAALGSVITFVAVWESLRPGRTSIRRIAWPGLAMFFAAVAVAGCWIVRSSGEFLK